MVVRLSLKLASVARSTSIRGEPRRSVNFHENCGETFAERRINDEVFQLFVDDLGRGFGGGDGSFVDSKGYAVAR